jgi:hypothetical protein
LDYENDQPTGPKTTITELAECDLLSELVDIMLSFVDCSPV